MKLQDVLQKVEPKEITGACDIEISGVQIDSRQITKGDLFVAERGTQVDGHKFIPAAVMSGSISGVCSPSRNVGAYRTIFCPRSSG